MIRQLVKVVRLTLKLAGLRLAIMWHSAIANAVLAGRFNWLGSRWHIRRGARMMGLHQRPDESWSAFQRRVFDAHRAETGLDVEALAQRALDERQRDLRKLGRK